MRAISRITLLLSCFSCLALPAAVHADSFVAMPELDASSKDLKIRWVRYDGGTNGAMVVEVLNSGNKAVEFQADGLYFLPSGDPEKAPQRLGAAGPFHVVGSKDSETRVEAVTLAPGEKKQLSLDVFCIDSHRGSPDSNTQFSVATERLPKSLRKELKESNRAIYQKHGNKYDAAKGEVQSNMWRTRDKKWIKLQGERAQEKQAPAPSHRNQVSPQQRQRRR